MKKQKKFKRIHKNAKILGALVLSALVFSSGVFAMPAKSQISNKGEIMTVIETMAQCDPSYIDQWNKEFSEGHPDFSEKDYLGCFQEKSG